MLSKNRIKQINALQQKKFRNESRTFVAEGHKVVMELLRSPLKVREIFATDKWIADNAAKFSGVRITEASDAEINKISAMQTACNVVAEVEMKPKTTFSLDANTLYLAMDSVRDPGNFGTIIRIANWFGISKILASNDCVDLYNTCNIATCLRPSPPHKKSVCQSMVHSWTATISTQHHYPTKA